jgi:uncharacterized protein (DUF1501 family)
MPLHLPSRREALLGAGSLFAWSQMPKLARAEGRDPRMLVIVLRGALDGLGAVAPVGDPDWIGLRGDRALVLDGKTPALPLDGFFALNPAMPNLYRLYKAREATIVHATATPYRERSHFDGQDVLESGIARPGAVDTGWLNRALISLASDGHVDPRGSRVLGVGAVTPLVVRGKAPVLSWTPQQLLPASDDTQARLLDLYQHTDAKLAAALDARIHLAALGGTAAMQEPRSDEAPQLGIARVRAYFADAAGTAARFLAKPDGPRVGALGFVGWDTHINEGATSGQLFNLLGALDGALAARDQHGRCVGRDGGCRHHRVRPHRAHQRHQRHRSRHRHRCLPRRRRAPGRPRGRGLAGTEASPALRGTRPQTNHRSARRAQGSAQGSSEDRRARARKQRISGQRRRRTDRRSGRLEHDVVIRKHTLSF